MSPSVSERFWAKVVRMPDGCWEWTATTWNGYGQFTIRHGVRAQAHRWVWENTRGPIPNGLTIDHLCRNKICVNPDHLEPVTTQVNNSRARAAMVAFRCGHPVIPENTDWKKPTNRKIPHRVCRTCHRRQLSSRVICRECGREYAASSLSLHRKRMHTGRRYADAA